MTIDTESAIVAAHRAAFLAGVRRDDDPPRPEPAEAATELGADDDPLDIRRGMQALAGAIVGGIAAGAVVAFVVLCTRVLA